MLSFGSQHNSTFTMSPPLIPVLRRATIKTKIYTKDFIAENKETYLKKPTHGMAKNLLNATMKSELNDTLILFVLFLVAITQKRLRLKAIQNIPLLN